MTTVFGFSDAPVSQIVIFFAKALTRLAASNLKGALTEDSQSCGAGLAGGQLYLFWERLPFGVDREVRVRDVQQRTVEFWQRFPQRNRHLVHTQWCEPLIPYKHICGSISLQQTSKLDSFLIVLPNFI